MSNQLTVNQFNAGVRELAQSSRDLSARFGQVRTVKGQIALIREELEEVRTATDDAHRVEELCDLIVVGAGLYDAAFAVILANAHIAKPPLEINEFRPYQGTDFDAFDLIMRTFVEMAGVQPTSTAFGIVLYVYQCITAIPNAAELFPAQVAAVVAKNAAKTADTHYLDSATGKITRKAGKECPRCGAVHSFSDFTSNVCPACEIEATQS